MIRQVVEIQLQLKVFFKFPCNIHHFFDTSMQELYKHMDNLQYHSNYITARNLMSQ